MRRFWYLIIVIMICTLLGCPNESKQTSQSEPAAETKITSLQAIIDDANAGAVIDLSSSEYADITDYKAAINKPLTLQNGTDLKGAAITVSSDGVVLDNIQQASVTTQSSMKISGSSLSSLNIAAVSSSGSLSSAEVNGRGSLTGRGSAFPPIVEVYDTEVEEDVSVGIVNAYLTVKKFTAKKNVILNAVNAQLAIMDKQTDINEIKSDKSCLVILEEGISDAIPTPTVTGNGIIKRIDMKASGDVKLLALAPVSELTSVIRQGEKIDFSTMAVLGSYQADDGVIGFRAGDLTYDMTERFSKLEKDFTITIDEETAYQAGQNVSSFQWSSLSVGKHTATLDKSYQYKEENYTAFTFDIVVIGVNESQTDEMPTFELTEIEVKSDAAKTEYTVGEPLNLSGLLVLGTYKEKDGEGTYQNVISDYTLDPSNGTLLTTANNSVTVKAGNYEKTVTIKVNPIQEEPLIFTVTLWNDGDVSGDKTVDVTYDVLMPNLTVLPSKIGYTFGGYYAEQNGEGTQYIDASGVGINKWDLTGDTTLYAYFIDKAAHQIVYQNIKGADIADKYTSFMESQKVTLPTITATGYTFLGWYDSSADTASQVTGWSAGERTADVTVWAKWDAITYTAAFNNNGGSGSMESQTFTFDVSQDISRCSFTAPTGYEFQNWNTAADGSGTSFADGQNVKNLTDKNETITLYAQWIVDSTIYVAAGAAGTGSGTKSNPFASISDAIEQINTLDDSNADYTIALSGKFVDAQTISSSISGKAKSLTLCGANGLDDSTHQPNDSIEVNGEENALTISTDIPVIVKDIKITKGTGETTHGVYVSDGSTLYLAGTPVIDDLYVENNEYYDYDNDETYGAIVIAENLSIGTSVTITPLYDYHYPYYDDYESYDVCITKYIYSVDGVNISDNCEYFHVTPDEGSSDVFFIDDNGNINKNLTVTFVSTATNQDFTESVLFGADLNELDIKPNEYDGYTFSGWFKSDDDGTTLTDKVTIVYEEDLTLYAKWTQPLSDLYVNTTSGSDDNAGTSDAQLLTVSAAVAKIKDFGVAMDYTIHVNGLTTEENKITLDENVSAERITFVGDSTVESGIKNKSYGSTPLVVETTIPVILNNFIVCADGYVNQYNDTLALYVGSDAEVTLNNGSKIYGSDTSSYGGKAGVRISGGTLTMNGDSEIYGFSPKYTGNEDTNASGGVLIEYSGQLIMNGTSSIHTCEANNMGGAIRLQSGSVVMNDSASIGGDGKGCSASTNGGAIYMSDGTFEMNDSSSISYCTKGSNGYGSIWIAGGSFTMNGGSIHDNTGGVQVASDACLFKMSGSAVVSSGNDVYLSSGAVITITGTLTGESPVSTITPSSYSTDTSVLTLADGADTTLEAECTKFAVTPQTKDNTGNELDVTVNWQINSSGQLSQQ